MKKTNPRKKPMTQMDVYRAWERGMIDGVANASAIFLTVIVDKFNGADHVQQLWEEINKLSEEIKEHRVSVADLRNVLKTEYGIEV